VRGAAEERGGERLEVRARVVAEDARGSHADLRILVDRVAIGVGDRRLVQATTLIVTVAGLLVV